MLYIVAKWYILSVWTSEQEVPQEYDLTTVNPLHILPYPPNSPLFEP